ncbi:MAG: NAD(P)H-dependent oxidoreductase [Burkholderiales bacterium]|nr:NAD(P)H-dependent oxidoreductase [Burkholderiales bacterium]
MILVIHAHPYPRNSRAGAALLEAIRDLPALELRSLYDLYPDFDIDVAAEQAALERANVVALMHPLYWYAVPAMLKHWIDAVLVEDWAHVERDSAKLKGKDCQWIVTTGDDEAYGPGAPTPVVEQIARACGMKWLEPFIVGSADQLSAEELREKGRALRARLEAHA